VLPKDPESEEGDTVAVGAAAAVALAVERRRVQVQERRGQQTDRRKPQLPSMASAEEESQNWSVELAGHPMALDDVAVAAAVAAAAMAGAVQCRRMGCWVARPLPIAALAAVAEAAHIGAGEVAAAGREAVDCHYFQQELELPPFR